MNSKRVHDFISNCKYRQKKRDKKPLCKNEKIRSPLCPFHGNRRCEVCVCWKE